MKNKKNFTITIIAVFLSSLILGMTITPNRTLSLPIDDSDPDLQPNILGTIDHSFSTAFGMWEIEYLNGLIYGVDASTLRLYVYDAVTGVNTVNYTTPTLTTGIATDGTNLYTTVATGATPNGTIIQLDLTGNEISRIHIPIKAGVLNGLAWDGNYLWAYQNIPSRLIRIDYDTGIVSRNITSPSVPHGMTWYDDLLWVENYGIDQTAAINPLTGAVEYVYSAPYHFDSGLTNNGTHFIQSSYAASPYEISFSEIPSEAGEIFTQSSQFSTNMLDIAYDGSDFFFTENGTDWIQKSNSVTMGISDVWSNGLENVGITVMDDILVVSTINAPYNLYTFTKDGTMLANHTALNVMLKSLDYDGTYLWAMGADNILYKLHPTNMSIASQYAVGNFKGITYDFVNEVIWLVSSIEHKVRYFDLAKEQLGNNHLNLTAPISPSEYGLEFDGEFLVITTSYGGGYYYRIIPCELDAEPPVTPTPTPTPTPFEGLFGLSNLYENLLFVGFGIVGTAIISFVIAILIRRKR